MVTPLQTEIAPRSAKNGAQNPMYNNEHYADCTKLYIAGMFI